MQNPNTKKKFACSLGYGENILQVNEFQTIDIIEADTAENAAMELFNGLEKDEETNAIIAVEPLDDEYGDPDYTKTEYFSFSD